MRTGADGAYLLRAAPPGAVTALMRAGDGQQVVAAAAGVLLAGAALRLDLTAGEAVRSLPGVLGSATLNPGLVLLVDSEHSAGQLRVNGAPFPEMAIARGAAAGLGAANPWALVPPLAATVTVLRTRPLPVPATIAPDESTEALVYKALCLGVRDYVTKNGFPGVLLGLSGGIERSTGWVAEG